MKRLLLIPMLLACRAAAAPVYADLPSSTPSGFPRNDRIPVEFYPAHASGPALGPAPAVVILHPLGERKMRVWRRFARYLAGRGIGAAVIPLPYHMARKPPHDPGSARFLAGRVDVAVQAFGQAISDVSTVTDWLAAQPGVDPNRLGVVGVSLGAIVAHTAMGRDSRLSAGVAFLGGGDLLRIRRHSVLFALVGKPAVTASDAAALAMVDPLTYAARNRPRHVLMVQAARDDLVPPDAALELWEALGRPPIQWIDTNHFALSWAVPDAMRLTADYLRSVWVPGAPSRLDPLIVPTITFGPVFGLDTLATPALRWEAVPLVTGRDHAALLHVDVGIGTRGAFTALSLSLNHHLDVGVGRRWWGHDTRAFIGLKETL